MWLVRRQRRECNCDMGSERGRLLGWRIVIGLFGLSLSQPEKAEERIGSLTYLALSEALLDPLLLRFPQTTDKLPDTSHPHPDGAA